MEPDELSQPLVFLQREIELKAEKLDFDFIGRLDAVLSNSPGIIEELKKKLSLNDTNFYRDIEKRARYTLLLAYAHDYNKNIRDSYLSAIEAESDFVIRQTVCYHEAISGWFLGLLYCKHGCLDEAERKIDEINEKILKWGNKKVNLGLYTDEYELLSKTMNKSYQDAVNRYKASGKRTIPNFREKYILVGTQSASEKNGPVDIPRTGPNFREKDIPAGTQPASKKSEPSGPVDTPLKHSNRTIGTYPSEPHLFYIKIPVDVKALKALVQNSTPLDAQSFELLKRYQ